MHVQIQINGNDESRIIINEIKGIKDVNDKKQPKEMAKQINKRNRNTIFLYFKYS